jgi:hypothetical protein
LSDNNLDIEEVTTQNKDEVLYKIFEAIDRGYPVILVSGGPWLYDATDLPELSWIEFSPESMAKWRPCFRDRRVFVERRNE